MKSHQPLISDVHFMTINLSSDTVEYPTHPEEKVSPHSIPTLSQFHSNCALHSYPILLFTLLPSPYSLSYIHSLTQSLFTLLPSPYSLSYPVLIHPFQHCPHSIPTLKLITVLHIMYIGVYTLNSYDCIQCLFLPTLALCWSTVAGRTLAFSAVHHTHPPQRLC